MNLTDNSNPQKNGRDIIARYTIWISLGGLIVLSFITIWNTPTEAKDIFNLILPVMGTWIGTILAFYFSRESIESANRNVREIVNKLSPMEKLLSIPVASTMIPIDQMMILKLGAEKPIDRVLLHQDIIEMLDEQNRNRLPVIQENGYPTYMIHRSMIDKYLSKKILSENLSPEAVKQLTLADLLNDDPELKSIFESGFVTISQQENLADAKLAMEKVPNCSDVFITATGHAHEPVLGWITNWIIIEHSQV